MKKLSIITICYNEKDAEKTCQSIVNQTWQDFEWIVIDGGSDQWCLDILKKYQHRMDYFVSEKDKGIYDAMNKGILAAKGEYLNFMNTGDCFADDAVLSDVVPQLKADIVYGAEERLYANNKMKLINQKFNFSPLFWICGFWLRHQASFIKKELFDKYGLYDLQYRSASDYEMFLRFIHVHKCSTLYVNRVIDVFKVYDGLSSANGNIGKGEVKLIYKKNFSMPRILWTLNMKFILRRVAQVCPIKAWRKKIRQTYRGSGEKDV